jgi:hypothetical protein
MMSLTSTGGAGFNSNANYSGVQARTMRTLQATDTQSNATGLVGTGGIRPPLYVPTKRDTGRSGMNSSLQKQDSLSQA